MKKLMQSVFDKRETLALLSGCCVFLSMIEYIIPKPLPFLRLGIANIPILISLEIFSPALSFVLVLLKIAGQGIITGTVFSYIFLFSFFGSVAGGAAMILGKNIFRKHISMIGISVLGALASNIIQLYIARLVIFGEAALIIAPPVLITGTVSSILIGMFAQSFISKSKWLSMVSNKISEKKPAKEPGNG